MRRFLLFSCVALACACDVYSARSGETSAGGVDPANFPPGYLGAGADRAKAGRGTFTEVRAYAGGMPIGYFAFPLSTAQLAPTPPGAPKVDPLRLVDQGKPTAAVPTPMGYDLSGVACTPPPGYVYDGRTDEVPLDQQLDIFTALPTATYVPGLLPTWSYAPVVARAQVTGGPIDCQGVKSEAKLLATPGLQVGATDGTFLARALIDPDAAVYRVGETQAHSFGSGTQKLGWYNHYIVAYLDGGTVPTSSPDGGATVLMTAMNLYYPRSAVTGPKGDVPGAIGSGYDVADFARDQPGYSPICRVFTYDAGKAPVPTGQLPKDVDSLKALFGSTFMPAALPYIYCFQVQS